MATPKYLTPLILLIVLSVTDAWMLSHPNLIGRVGVLIYEHDYIRTFPRALLTVGSVVGVYVLLSEVIGKIFPVQKSLMIYLIMCMSALFLFLYVYKTFSSFMYSHTGKSFVFGAHLLPIILLLIAGRYLVKTVILLRNSRS